MCGYTICRNVQKTAITLATVVRSFAAIILLDLRSSYLKPTPSQSRENVELHQVNF